MIFQVFAIIYTYSYNVGLANCCLQYQQTENGESKNYKETLSCASVKYRVVVLLLFYLFQYI